MRKRSPVRRPRGKANDGLERAQSSHHAPLMFCISCRAAGGACLHDLLNQIASQFPCYPPFPSPNLQESTTRSSFPQPQGVIPFRDPNLLGCYLSASTRPSYRSSAPLLPAVLIRTGLFFSALSAASASASFKQPTSALNAAQPANSRLT